MPAQYGCFISNTAEKPRRVAATADCMAIKRMSEVRLLCKPCRRGQRSVLRPSMSDNTTSTTTSRSHRKQPCCIKIANTLITFNACSLFASPSVEVRAATQLPAAPAGAVGVRTWRRQQNFSLDYWRTHRMSGTVSQYIFTPSTA